MIASGRSEEPPEADALATSPYDGIVTALKSRAKQSRLAPASMRFTTSPTTSTKKVFFMHNPKAGGTSLLNWLSQSVGAVSICPIIENDRCDHAALSGDYSSFKGHDFYFGHYGRDVYEAVAPGGMLLTNFRHPVTRVLSLYNYFRHTVQADSEILSTSRYAAVAAAKSLDFAEFVACRDPRVLVYTSDFHFRQITGSPWVLESRGSVAEAVSKVRSMDWFYIAEMPEHSIAWALHAFDLRRAHPVDWRNIASAATRLTYDEVSETDRNRILQMNLRDLVLYETAGRQLCAWVGRLLPQDPGLFERARALCVRRPLEERLAGA